MIDFNVMEAKIKSKEAKVIKVNERSARNGKYSKIVELHDIQYKLCIEPDCLFYKTLDSFTFVKSSNCHHNKCKACRAKGGSAQYKNDASTHIRIRLAAINRKVKKPKDKCTIEEFTEFFNTARCALTGRTLLEDWQNPHPNPNFKLEVDHKIPVSDGGSSKPRNLQVVPRFINALKRDCTTEQYRETLDFIGQFGVKVR